MMTKHEPKGGIFIGELSDDVLNIILSDLFLKASVTQAAQVCQRLRALAMPFLYRRLRLTTTGSDYSSLTPDDLPPGLIPDSLSLNRKYYPDLCNHVRKLNLKVHNISWYENTGGHQRLIKFLPSLQELSLRPAPKVYNFQMNDRFTNMKLDFSYDFKDFWAPMTPDGPISFDLNEYLSKPTLRKLQFEHAGQACVNLFHSGIPGNSTTTDLRFIHWSPQKLDVLKLILPSVKDLQNFVLEATEKSLREYMHSLAPHDYGLLLRPHSASLEELTIAYSEDTYDEGRAFPVRAASPVMGTFVDFQNLKKLALPHRFLVHPRQNSYYHEILPPRLEVLQIQFPESVREAIINARRHSEREGLVAMHKLAANKENFVPRLRHVIWWYQQPSYMISTTIQPSMTQIADEFEKAGVKFECVTSTFLRDTPIGAALGIAYCCRCEVDSW